MRTSLHYLIAGHRCGISKLQQLLHTSFQRGLRLSYTTRY